MEFVCQSAPRYLSSERSDFPHLASHVEMSNSKCNFAFLQHFSIIQIIMLEKCLLTILELNWNQRLNICYHILASSTQLQNRSFHVVERTRTSSKWQKMHVQSKNTVFHCQICKFLGFLLPNFW